VDPHARTLIVQTVLPRPPRGVFTPSGAPVTEAASWKAVAAYELAADPAAWFWDAAAGTLWIRAQPGDYLPGLVAAL
jgi:hypothetical protein